MIIYIGCFTVKKSQLTFLPVTGIRVYLGNFSHPLSWLSRKNWLSKCRENIKEEVEVKFVWQISYPCKWC